MEEGGVLAERRLGWRAEDATHITAMLQRAKRREKHEGACHIGEVREVAVGASRWWEEKGSVFRKRGGVEEGRHREGRGEEGHRLGAKAAAAKREGVWQW